MRCARTRRCTTVTVDAAAVVKLLPHGTIGPMYDLAATTLSYHFFVSPTELLPACSERLKRSIFSVATSRSRRFGQSPTTFPSTHTVMRPSRTPGVFAFTISSYAYQRSSSGVTFGRGTNVGPK